jgi:hypothetical protein
MQWQKSLSLLVTLELVSFHKIIKNKNPVLRAELVMILIVTTILIIYSLSFVRRFMYRFDANLNEDSTLNWFM